MSRLAIRFIGVIAEPRSAPRVRHPFSTALRTGLRYEFVPEQRGAVSRASKLLENVLAVPGYRA